VNNHQVIAGSVDDFQETPGGCGNLLKVLLMVLKLS